MAILSNNAQKALEQVKNGLLVLYGADYFTDEEWLRIDHVIHKGRYVFTRGPTTTHMLDEPLMSFAEPVQEISDSIESCTKKEKHNTWVSEPTEPTSSIFETGTPTFSSAHNFADEDPSTSPSPITTPNLSESAEIPRLPTGYTQAQLEESKAFRSAVQTKAHHHSESPPWTDITNHHAGRKSPLATETLVSSWASEVGESADTGSPHHSVSTLALQDETPRYRGLASSSFNPAVPTKEFYYNEYVKKYGRAPRSLGDYWQPNNPEYKGPNLAQSRSVASATSLFSQRISPSKATTSIAQSYSKAPSKDKSEQLTIGLTYFAIQDQIKTSKIQLEVTQGDLIRVTNLVSGVTYVGQSLRTGARGQVKAALLRPLTMSTDPSESPKPVQSTIAPKAPIDDPVPATVEKQAIKHEQPVADKELLEVVASLEQQNSENEILAPAEEQLKEDTTSANTPDVSKPLFDAENGNIGSNWGVLPSIDMIETLNAAEWDEEPSPLSKPSVLKVSEQQKKPESEPVPAWESVTARRGKQALPPSPVATRPTIPLSSSSRFSVLSDESSNTAVTPAMQAAIDRGVREALGNQMDSIRQTFSPALTPFNPSASKYSKSRKDSVPKLYPKTNTCWFWATNKGCRFTDEECRDLHSHTNALGEPTNFHNGKPTWGALADYLPAPGTASTKGGGGNEEKLTCWFWADKGKCMYSDEECKYAHEQMPGGVARPGGWKHPVARDSWRRVEKRSWEMPPPVEAVESGAWDEAKSPSVPAEDSGWGADEPSHVTDLQRRLQQEEVGW